MSAAQVAVVDGRVLSHAADPGAGAGAGAGPGETPEGFLRRLRAELAGARRAARRRYAREWAPARGWASALAAGDVPGGEPSCGEEEGGGAAGEEEGLGEEEEGLARVVEECRAWAGRPAGWGELFPATRAGSEGGGWGTEEGVGGGEGAEEGAEDGAEGLHRRRIDEAAAALGLLERVRQAARAETGVEKKAAAAAAGGNDKAGKSVVGCCEWLLVYVGDGLLVYAGDGLFVYAGDGHWIENKGRLCLRTSA